MPPAVTHTSLSFLFATEAKLPMARQAMSPEIDFNHISTKEMIFFLGWLQLYHSGTAGSVSVNSLGLGGE